MISGELNTLRLAMTDNPVPGTDTLIDFLTPDTGTGNGYGLQGYSYSAPEYSDVFNRETTVVTITTSLLFSNPADLNSRIVAIQSMISRTREFIKTFRGNIPSSTNVNWFPGKAAVLTWQPLGGRLQYWNVIDGSITRDVEILQDVTKGWVANLTISLICEGKCRGARVTLTNGFINPIFEPENGEALTILPLGWSSSPTLSSIITDTGGFTASGQVNYSDFDLINDAGYAPGYYPVGFPRYARCALSIGGAWNGTIYSNAFGPGTTAYIISMWVGFYRHGDETNPAHTVNLSVQGNIGSTWSYSQALFTLQGETLPTNQATLLQYMVDKVDDTGVFLSCNWYRLQTVVLCSGTSNRLAITANNYGQAYPTDGGRIYLTGFEAHPFLDYNTWDHVTQPSATNEYLAGNWAGNNGTFRLFNVQGDTSAPATLTMQRSTVTGEANQTHFALGSHAITAQGDYPLYPQDMMPTTTATNTDTTGVIIGGKYQGTATAVSGSQTSFSAANLVRRTDNQPRRYLAFLYYAADDKNNITSVDVILGIQKTTYQKTIANTWLSASRANPLTTDFKMVLLGELWYPKQPAASVDRLNTNQLLSVNINEGTYTGTPKVACNGVFLIPFDQFGVLENLTITTAGDPSIHITNEGTEPVVDPTVNGFLDKSFYRLTGWDFMLRPGDNRFVYLALSAMDRSVSPPLLTPAPTTASGTSAGGTSGYSATSPLLQFTVSYTPRYYLDI